MDTGVRNQRPTGVAPSSRPIRAFGAEESTGFRLRIAAQPCARPELTPADWRMLDAAEEERIQRPGLEKILNNLVKALFRVIPP